MTTGAQIDSITSRIDRITDIPAEYRGTVIPAPKSVKIELTSKCNFGCSFCAHKLNGKDHGDMDIDFYERIVKEMRSAGVEELGLFYIGESLMCGWLPEAVMYAKDIGFPYVFLTTNGSAATPERMRQCMDAGLDSLKFSLNFTDLAQFEEVAAVFPSLYRRAIANLKAAKKVREDGGYSCGIYASSIAFDGDQGTKMRALVDEIRPFVDEHYWLPLYGMSGASKASGWKPKAGNPGRLDAMRESLPCWSVFTEGHITAGGMLSACCFGNGADDALAMADLNSTPFMDAWNCSGYQALRTAHLAKDVRATACAECAAG